jgi:hypothetical protein
MDAGGVENNPDNRETPTEESRNELSRKITDSISFMGFVLENALGDWREVLANERRRNVLLKRTKDLDRVLNATPSRRWQELARQLWLHVLSADERAHIRRRYARWARETNESLGAIPDYLAWPRTIRL